MSEYQNNCSVPWLQKLKLLEKQELRWNRTFNEDFKLDQVTDHHRVSLLENRATTFDQDHLQKDHNQIVEETLQDHHRRNAKEQHGDQCKDNQETHLLRQMDQQTQRHYSATRKDPADKKEPEEDQAPQD